MIFLIFQYNIFFNFKSNFILNKIVGTIKGCLFLQIVQWEDRGGKNTHVHGYQWVKYVTGTRRIAKRVFTDIINGYLTTHYYMDTDTDLIVSIPMGTIPDNKLSKLQKYLYISYLIT